MADALAGAKVRAVDIVDTIVADAAVDTTVGSAAANFSSPAATVRTLAGGKIVFFTLVITTTNALNAGTPGTGNIGDVTCFTLDTAYRPTEPVGFAFGSNATGFGVVNTNGTIVLWTASDTITAGGTIRLSAMWIRA